MTLRVGLLGYGSAGSLFHAPFIQTTPGLELSVVLSSRPERQQQVKQRYPTTRVAGDFEEFWRAEPDVVVVALPNRLHLPVILQALERGLAVVVDKPLTCSLEEARQIPPGAPLHVFQNRRWDGDFLTIQQLVQEGRLGSLVRFESRFDRWRPVPRPGAWRESPEEGGGLVLDLGSHLVDQALTLLGPPLSVYAEMGCYRAGASVEDDCFVAIEHYGGVRSHLWMSNLAAFPSPRFRLIGVAGSYQSEGLDPQEKALREGYGPDRQNWGRRPEEEWGRLMLEQQIQSLEMLAGDYGAFYRKLVACLRDGAPSPVSLAEGLLVMEVLQSIRESAASGRSVLFKTQSDSA